LTICGRARRAHRVGNDPRIRTALPARPGTPQGRSEPRNIHSDIRESNARSGDLALSSPSPVCSKPRRWRCNHLDQSRPAARAHRGGADAVTTIRTLAEGGAALPAPV
jgi:hypothetical protein